MSLRFPVSILEEWQKDLALDRLLLRDIFRRLRPHDWHSNVSDITKGQVLHALETAPNYLLRRRANLRAVHTRLLTIDHVFRSSKSKSTHPLTAAELIHSHLDDVVSWPETEASLTTLATMSVVACSGASSSTRMWCVHFPDRYFKSDRARARHAAQRRQVETFARAREIAQASVSDWVSSVVTTLIQEHEKVQLGEAAEAKLLDIAMAKVQADPEHHHSKCKSSKSRRRSSSHSHQHLSKDDDRRVVVVGGLGNNDQEVLRNLRAQLFCPEVKTSSLMISNEEFIALVEANGNRTHAAMLLRSKVMRTRVLRAVKDCREKQVRESPEVRRWRCFEHWMATERDETFQLIHDVGLARHFLGQGKF